MVIPISDSQCACISLIRCHPCPPHWTESSFNGNSVADRGVCEMNYIYVLQTMCVSINVCTCILSTYHKSIRFVAHCPTRPASRAQTSTTHTYIARLRYQVCRYVGMYHSSVGKEILLDKPLITHACATFKYCIGWVLQRSREGMSIGRSEPVSLGSFRYYWRMQNQVEQTSAMLGRFMLDPGKWIWLVETFCCVVTHNS